MQPSNRNRRTSLVRTVVLGALVASLVTAVALAASPNTYKVTSKLGTTKAGTKKKPAPTSGKFTYDVTGATKRPEVISKVNFGWTGIKINGKDFPECSTGTIDAKQSDADCPKGSLMATGDAIALAGPPSDKNTAFTCKTSAKVFNGGAKKQTVWLIPDPANCAGVQYLAPFEGKVSKARGGGSKVSITFPENVVAPLPGIEGAATHFALRFRKATTTVKVKGKKVKVGYLQGVGCAGKAKRTFTMVSTDTADTVPATASAGRCKK